METSSSWHLMRPARGEREVCSSANDGFRDQRGRRRGRRRDAPDLHDLPDLIHAVAFGRDDEHPVEQINRDPVRALVLGSSDPGHTSVRRHDDQRREVVLERSVEKGEALNVEHVNLVDEEDL